MIMKWKKMNLLEALKYMGGRRYICVNEGFFAQLVEYEKEIHCKGVPSISYSMATERGWTCITLPSKASSQEGEDPGKVKAKEDYLKWKKFH